MSVYDILYIRKIVSHLKCISLDDCGLHLVSSNTCGNSKRLVSLQPSLALISKSCAYRASKVWSSLPLRTTNIKNMASFKKRILSL